MATTPFPAELQAALKSTVQSAKLFAFKGLRVVPQWFCCISGNTVGVDKDPIAHLVLDTTRECIGETFTATYSGSWSGTSTIATWEVDWGDGNTSGGAWPGAGSVAHPAGGYLTAGTFTVKLTVIDLLGAEGYAEVQVEVIDCLLLPLVELVAGCGASGAWHTEDGGISWHSIGLDGIKVYDLKANWFIYGELWAATENGVYKTTNMGDTWKLIATPPGVVYKAIAVSKYSQDEVYILGQIGSTVYLSRTEDGGDTWTSLQMIATAPGCTLLYSGINDDFLHGKKMDHYGDSQYFGVAFVDNIVGVEAEADTVTEYDGDANDTKSVGRWADTFTQMRMTGGDGYFAYIPAHPLGPWFPVDTTYKPYIDWARDTDGHSLDGQNIDGALVGDYRFTVIGESGGVFSVYATQVSLYYSSPRWVLYDVHPTHGWGWWVFANSTRCFVTVATGGVVTRHNATAYGGKYPIDCPHRKFIIDTASGDTGWAYPMGNSSGVPSSHYLYVWNEISATWGDDTAECPGNIVTTYVDQGTQTLWAATDTGIYERDPATLTYTLKCEFPNIKRFIRYVDTSFNVWYYILTDSALYKVAEGYSSAVTLPTEGFYHLVDTSLDGAYVYAAMLFSTGEPCVIRAEYDLLNPTTLLSATAGTWAGVHVCTYEGSKVWLFGDFGTGSKVLSCTDYGDTQVNVTEGTWGANEVVRAIMPSFANPNNVMAILNDAQECWKSGDGGNNWTKKADLDWPAACATRDPWESQAALIGRLTSGAEHLKLTINTGKTWKERSSGITANAPINAIEVIG